LTWAVHGKVAPVEFGYRGGVCPGRGTAMTAVPAGDSNEHWSYPAREQSLFVDARGCARLFVWDALALLIRGYARPVGSTLQLALETAAEEARVHYLECGDLAVEELDGSFTLALLDGQTGRVLLYRNLVGSGSTYYHHGRNGFLFGSNLADLVDASGGAPLPN